MTSKEVVSVAVIFVHQTSLAVLVEDVDKNKVWIPKSLIQNEDTEIDLERGNYFDLCIPEWLAYDKGLI